ncbi:MAG: transposase [Opitutae bacterium]|nr:transposase [Opitutae bacterium]
MRRAGGRNRSAAFRLQSRQTQLCWPAERASGRRPGGHAGKAAARLRDVPGPHRRQDHPCAGRIATSLVTVAVAGDGALAYRLDRARLRAARAREGRYLLRTNLAADDPELIWRCYMQLGVVEEAFRTLKGDLGLRPIFHQRPDRIEAHLFVAFLASCLTTTLRQLLRGLAGSLMPRRLGKTRHRADAR